MRLHLGCGRDIRDGWINIDSVALPGVDVVADLDNCAATPLPFDDDTVDEIEGIHLIEHLRNPLPLMQELHRIAKPDALATFACPFGSSDDAWEDPTHVRPYYLGSWSYFGQPNYWRADYGYRGDWDCEDIRLVIPESIGRLPDGSLRGMDEVMLLVKHQRNIVVEMTATLRCVKPVREPLRELQTQANMSVALAVG